VSIKLYALLGHIAVYGLVCPCRSVSVSH